jgi:CO dehydrogenase/acetyl-CoA synthase alpha subunit
MDWGSNKHALKEELNKGNGWRRDEIRERIVEGEVFKYEQKVQIRGFWRGCLEIA